MNMQLTAEELDGLLTALNTDDSEYGLSRSGRALRERVREALTVALDEESAERNAEAHEQAVAVEGGPYARLG